MIAAAKAIVRIAAAGIAAVQEIAAAVGIIHDQAVGVVADHHGPVAAAAGRTGAAVVQPADGHGPAGIDFGLEHGQGAVGAEGGLETNMLKRLDLGLGIGGVTEGLADGVVLVLIFAFAPELGQHSTAGGETFTPTLAIAHQHLVEVGNRQGVGVGFRRYRAGFGLRYGNDRWRWARNWRFCGDRRRWGGDWGRLCNGASRGRPPGWGC